jgi:hypothetical protein
VDCALPEGVRPISPLWKFLGGETALSLSFSLWRLWCGVQGGGNIEAFQFRGPGFLQWVSCMPVAPGRPGGLALGALCTVPNRSCVLSQVSVSGHPADLLESSQLGLRCPFLSVARLVSGSLAHQSLPASQCFPKPQELSLDLITTSLPKSLLRSTGLHPLTPAQAQTVQLCLGPVVPSSRIVPAGRGGANQ